MSADLFAELIATSVSIATPLTEEYNELAEKVAHAGNSAKRVYEVRDEIETTDEKILEYRAWLAKAEAAIAANKEGIKKYIVDAGLVDVAPVDVPAVTAQAKEIKGKIDSLRKAVAAFPGGTEAFATLPELTRLPGVSRASSGPSDGTQTKRPRISSVTLDGNNVVDANNKTNMTVLKLHLQKDHKVNVEVSKLQELLFAAAGTQDLSDKSGESIPFTLSIPAAEGVEATDYAIVVVPS